MQPGGSLSISGEAPVYVHQCVTIHYIHIPVFLLFVDQSKL